jgi:hypothetical protein
MKKLLLEGLIVSLALSQFDSFLLELLDEAVLVVSVAGRHF